jgi:hypothetical protein
MPISEKTRRIVWVKSAGTCAICRRQLHEEYSSGGDTHLLGAVAHIVADREKGARGNSILTDEERDQESNLLLLCLEHHKIVDDDDVAYPVARLQEIKLAHEHWVASKLRLEQTWGTKLHHLYYINVPRLNTTAAAAGCYLDLERYGNITALHELGGALGGLMLGFDNLLMQVELRAVDLAVAVGLLENARGMLVSFDRDFRTKNIRMPESPAEYLRAVTGNLAKDPHIYTDVAGMRVVMRIDPRWITTTTAFSEFRPSSGKNKFAGLGIINSVDIDQRMVNVTPYVIGLPSNPFMEQFYGAFERDTDS